MKTEKELDAIHAAARAAVGNKFYDLPTCIPLTRDQAKIQFDIELPAGVNRINRYFDQFQADIDKG